MGSKQGVLRLLVLVAVGGLCEPQAPGSFWPHVLTQDQLDEFWKLAQYPAAFRPRASPSEWQPPPLQEQVQAPSGVQSNQELQGEVKELTWKFPVVQMKPKQQPVHLALRQPIPPSSVAVKCGENEVQVEVKRDFFGTGRLIAPSSVTLGGCPVTEEDTVARVLVFHSALHGCNSLKVMTGETIVYMFNLIYNASAGSPIVRVRSAAVGVECHYARKHNVSSNALKPTWIPYASTKAVEDVLVFSLTLMADDWTSERTSDVYFLGDMINVEASVMQFNHVGLRVFVDSCVAAASPNMNADPRYTFIENHGCFTDSKISNSSFIPRLQRDKLWFHLEAFQFQEDTGSMYITCLLKATAATSPTDVEHKACSSNTTGWTSADRDDQVCSCCDSNCAYRNARYLERNQDMQWEGKATIGPLFVQDD
ncbi:hypothetical protein NFI96_018051 [Prochilodus magdalenae]|nr:hypothetical protein NFI96_018051 [Prochilodus magdalenae]